MRTIDCLKSQDRTHGHVRRDFRRHADGGDRAEVGVDVLAIANQLQEDPDLAAKTMAIVKQLLHEGKLTPARIDES